MKIGKYTPFAFIYFFINSVGLPFGLLYTTILTPVFYLWIFIKGKRWIIVKFIVFLFPFMIFHLINGVDTYLYVRSTVLFFTVYIFCYALYTLVTTTNNLERIFEGILALNAALTAVALCLLFTPYHSLLWWEWTLSLSSISIEDFPRLMMLTYEPSYYATLLVPVFVFYFIGFLFRQIPRRAFTKLLLIGIPLVLTFSIGVISSLVVSIVIMTFLHFSKVFGSRKRLQAFSVLTGVIFVGLVVLLLFYRDNPFFVRTIAFLSGNDQSGRARTTEAFQLGYLIAEAKSVWWGVGPGQVKIIGDPIIKEFYRYQPGYGQVNIPNAFGETLALFGFVGAFLRLFVELYLFVKTKVLANYFRTTLFFYIFIYQFTGSFTTNIAEYVIWILAFSNAFPQFDRKARVVQPTQPLSS